MIHSARKVRYHDRNVGDRVVPEVKLGVNEQWKDCAWPDGKNTANGVEVTELVILHHLDDVLELMPALPNNGERHQREHKRAKFLSPAPVQSEQQVRGDQ